MTKLRTIDECPERMYVIGDLHGCPDEPAALLDHLVGSEGLNDKDLVVFVGDYVDRGPDSKGVIDLLLEFQRRFSNVVFLKGNHEDMLLEYLGYDGRLGHSYIMNGGAVALQSYGLSIDLPVEEVLESFPALHVSFLLNLDSYIEVNNFVVAHAGMNPLRDLRAQLDEDLFWIRDEFINNIHYFQKVVLFGHTPYQDIMFHLPYKLGLDTGLVFGNKLSCIEPFTGKIFQVDHGDKTVVVDSLERRGIPLPLLPEGVRRLDSGRMRAEHRRTESIADSDTDGEDERSEGGAEKWPSVMNEDQIEDGATVEENSNRATNLRSNSGRKEGFDTDSAGAGSEKDSKVMEGERKAKKKSLEELFGELEEFAESGE